MDPINSEVLGTNVAKSSVLVNVNGVRAMCNGDCSYEVVSTGTPVVSTAGLANNVLTLSIAGTGLTLGAFDVELGGQTCTYDPTSAALTAYKCTLPINGADATSPVLEAGSHTPTVHIPSVGYADTSAALATVQY